MNNILMAINITDFTKGTIIGVNNGEYSDANTLIEGKIITGINYVIIFSALIAVIMLIVAGYTFITSAGDAEKVEKATKTVTAAIIGMVIVFVARILVQYVLSVISGQ